jgi:hypothetical protein
VSDPLWIVENRLDMGPHDAFETITAHRAVGAHRLSVEPVSITADAAIGAVTEGAGAMALSKPRCGFTVIGIATPPTHNQPLEQPPWPSALLPLTPSVLLKLSSGGLGDRGIDKGWHRHRHPILAWDRHACGRA